MSHKEDYFKDRVIWLIGASTGIGNALAHKLSIEPCKALILSARNENQLEDLKAELEKYNTKATISVKTLDASSQESIIKRFSEIKEELGSVDTLIYNAGIYTVSDYNNFKSSEYIQQMEVNFFGSLYATEAVLPDMRIKKHGHLVVVSSVAGYRALPRAFGYGSTKAAMTYFFDSLRLHLEDEGIQVTTVHPGFVKTRLTDKNDFQMPFLMEVDEAAEIMKEGIWKQKRDIAFPFIFVFILKTLGLLPLFIYNSLIKKIGIK